MTVMGTTRYDPLDRASLQLWMEGRNDDNHLQLERLLRNLPLAVEQELPVELLSLSHIPLFPY